MGKVQIVDADLFPDNMPVQHPVLDTDAVCKNLRLWFIQYSVRCCVVVNVTYLNAPCVPAVGN